MEKKFKVGDRVITTSSCGAYFPAGSVGTVVKVLFDINIVDLDNKEGLLKGHHWPNVAAADTSLKLYDPVAQAEAKLKEAEVAAEAAKAELEAAVKAVEDSKQFQLEDIKPGLVVEFEFLGRYRVLVRAGNTLAFVDPRGWTDGSRPLSDEEEALGYARGTYKKTNKTLKDIL